MTVRPAPEPTVATVMSGSVVSVRPDATCNDIAELLYTFAIGAVPVLDAHDELVGVVSAADLFRGCGGTDVRRVAAEVMTRRVVIVDPEASLSQTATLMRRRRLRWLPVVSNRRVVGIVSRSDLLRVFLPADEDVLGEVLAALAGALSREVCDAIEVDVHAGVVTLTGRLPSRADARIASREVGLVAGVSRVIDRMEVAGQPVAELVAVP